MADKDMEQQKLAYFQEITGVKDSSLSHQILDAYGWDLDSAIQAMVDKNTNAIPEYEESMRVSANGNSDVQPDVQATSVGRSSGLNSGSSSTPSPNPLTGSTNPVTEQSLVDNRSLFERIGDGDQFHAPDDTTCFAIERGSYQGVAIEALTHPTTAPIVSVPSGASEASNFLRAYERRYGDYHPEFQAVSFMEALRRAGQEFKFLFVYLHAPQHVNTPSFCETTFRNDAVVDFINENFIAWGADIQKTEGYQMSNSLNASTFPFCAIITGSTHQRIVVVSQVEGFKTAGELLTVLQNVVEEQSESLIAGRQEQEARELNCRLREEQDEAYRIGLQTDQERERREQAEADQAARERFDADQKEIQDEKEAAQVAQISALKEANLARQRHDKASSLGPEPQRGADVTHVAVRLPTGERKERRFLGTAKVQALYDYVESLNNLESDSFLLVSNFPRIEYGPDKLDLTLKDAGLHPRTSLFVQMQDS